MNIEILQFFDKHPDVLPLYQAFEELILAKLPEFNLKVQKTQITLTNRHVFACASLRKFKGRPKVDLIITFGLAHEVTSSRIFQAVEPYPNRWTHHVIIGDESEIDEQLSKWVEEAYDFALTK